MQLEGIATSAYILIFKDTGMADQLIKEGYRHVYCLTDQKILPEYTQIKYYPYSLETHFPNNMFNVIVHKSLEDEPKDIGQFFLESYRIGMQSATIIATFGSTTKNLTIKDKPMEDRKFKKVNIVCNSLGLHEGIAEYSSNLKQRFEQDGIEVNLVKSLTQIDPKCQTIFEYEIGMAREVPEDANTIIEAHFTGYASMFIEEIAYRVKLAIESRSIRFILKETKRLMKLLYIHPEYLWNAILRSNPYTKEKLERCKLLVRHPFLASKSDITKYTLMPHIAYPKIEINQKQKDGQIRLGSFGFAVESKNFDKICNLAIRLNVSLVLLMSINQLTPKVSKMHLEYATEIQERYKKQDRKSTRLNS